VQQYSEEYKESLASEFMELHELYNKVIEQAGEGPYNEEEQQIISDYEDVCEEYEEVFNKKPKYKIPFFQKIYRRSSLPVKESLLIVIVFLWRFDILYRRIIY